MEVEKAVRKPPPKPRTIPPKVLFLLLRESIDFPRGRTADKLMYRLDKIYYSTNLSRAFNYMGITSKIKQITPS